MSTVVITPNTFYNNTFMNVTTTGTTNVWHGTPVRRYWYRIERRECRLCGEVYETRQRMDTPRPEKREDRVEHTFFYDYCG